MDDKLIFYYCNIATAFSILKNNEIWMTKMCIRDRHKRGRNNKIKKLNLERELRPGSAW